MTAKIRWGVLGNATVARKCVIPAIQKSCNGRVHALATRHPAAAARLAADNQIERIYDRYETLLEDPAVDAVYIPLPNHLHRPWTLKALSAGKHVLCEKPIACTAQEAREMANAADRGNLFLMEAFMYRFHPRSREIKQMVSGGRIVAGLVGGTYWGWLYTEILWVTESLRGQGYGQSLLAAAEAEAVRRGCRSAHLDTMDFQALRFYEKQGYSVFAELEDIPAGSGHRRYSLKKRLASGQA